MKRIIASILVLVLSFFSTACGISDSGPDKNSLPPLEDKVSTVSTAAPVNTEPAATSVENIIYSETLENGLKITVLADGVLRVEGANVEENFKTRNIFKDYVANINTLEIGNGVLVVGEKAFLGYDKLQKVIVGDYTEEIHYSAFSGCSALTDVTFGNSVKKIEDYVFSDCISLKDAVLGDSVEYLGSYVFSGCTALKNAQFGTNITSMGDNIFSGCTSFVSLRSGSNIARSAFSGNTRIESVVMEETVTSIGERAFNGCKALKNVTFSQNLEEIGDYAFAECINLDVLDLPESDGLVIGDSAFNGCKGLTTVYLPDGVTEIGEKAFAECSSLEKIILPKTLTKLGYGILMNTEKLRTIGYRGSGYEWNTVITDRDGSWNKDAGTYSVKFDME